MRTFINASDLQNITGFHISVCYRKLQKVKELKNYNPFDTVSIADFVDVFGGDYIEIYARINTVTHQDYIKLYYSLKKAQKEGVLDTHLEGVK